MRGRDGVSRGREAASIARAEGGSEEPAARPAETGREEGSMFGGIAWALLIFPCMMKLGPWSKRY